MVTVSEEVELGRDLPLPQLAVDEGRCHRGVFVRAAVEHAHRRRLLVKLENRVELRVDRLAVAGVRNPDPVRHRVCDRSRYCPVDVAGNFVKLVDLFVRGGECARREERRKMRARRHRNRTYLLRVEAALRRLGAHHPDGALAVLPRGLVYREPLWTRRTVHEVDALEARRCEFLLPHLDKPDIAAAVVSTAGDEDHAASVRLLGCGTPVKIRGLAFLLLVCHRRDQVILRVGHLALRPDVLALRERGKRHRAERAKQHCFLYHTLILSFFARRL